MLNVTVAQLNFRVGDIEGNLKKILQTLKEFHGETHVVLFPELALSGYPPEDLLLQKHFLDESIFFRTTAYLMKNDTSEAEKLPFW